MEERKIPLLKAIDIEVKVKQCTEKGAVALLYKTARVDMAILDLVYGAENWECDYKEIKGNLYCGIGVRTAEDKPFVWKWDCGIESREDGEGNQKKGEASDSFKRAGFKWGIGRELYTSPFIFLQVPTVAKDNGKVKATYVLANPYSKFECQTIEYDDNGSITKVVIVDDKGTTVYPKTNTQSKPISEKKQSKFCQIATLIGDTDLTMGDVNKWIVKYFGEKIEINNLSDEQFTKLTQALNKRKDADNV